jgi:purine catabolism regulator
VVACSHSGRGTEELLRDWEQRSRLTPLTVGTGRSGPEHWMSTPVGIRGGVWGRLVALGPELDETRARLVLERAAQALELGRMIERDEIALQLRAQGGFLLGLLEDRLGSEADAVSRLAALGVRPGQAYVGVAVGHATGATAHDLTPARQAVELSERLAEVLASQGVDGAVGMVAADRVGALVALPTPEAELPTVDRLARALGALDHDLRLGVGGVHPRLLGAAASLRAARRVVEVAVTMPGGDRIAFRHADVRLNGLLGALRDDVRVQEFVESELGPLLEREARGPSGLLQLLRDYVEVGGNKVELSRRTHRSRSALYVRLEELQRVLGCSLDEPRSRLALGVALLAYDQQHAV